MSMDDERPSAHVAGLPAAASELPWSADFVMQAIEILPVALRDGRLYCLRPIHADSFVVGWPVRARPEEVALKALAQLGMEPIVLHSTSWRQADDEVVLTYLAVVSQHTRPPVSWELTPVTHAELARGEATAPPVAVGVAQVQEHALRHLAWLLRDDAVIAGLLSDWSNILADYVPEPFRAFGGPSSAHSSGPNTPVSG